MTKITVTAKTLINAWRLLLSQSNDEYNCFIFSDETKGSVTYNSAKQRCSTNELPNFIWVYLRIKPEQRILDNCY
ncbi:MAG: hypothetical protein HRU06_02055 [Oceanospirillaceae bacterium]|nr:hypothetical protein [Oceanospirillaceae bacterium]